MGSINGINGEDSVSKQPENLDGDILISKLNDLELNEELQITNNGRAEFDMGEVIHPKYGKAYIKGCIPLTLSNGIYQHHSQESKDRAFNIILNWFEKNHFYFGETEEDKKYIWMSMDLICYMFPINYSIDSPLMISMIGFNILANFIDDMYETTYLTSQISLVKSGQNFELYKYMTEPLNDILNGKYKNVNEIPNLDFPMLQPTLWFAYLSYEFGIKDRINFSNELKYFIKEQSKLYEIHTICSDKKFMNSCSNETYLYLCEYESCSQMCLESLILLYNIQLTKEIRSNLILKRIRSGFSRIIILNNDLFGIEKEFETECPNIILRTMDVGFHSFQEIINITINKIQIGIKDLIECCNKLLQIYSNNENIERLVDAIKYAIDGQLPYYMSTSRYGQDNKLKVNINYD